MRLLFRLSLAAVALMFALVGIAAGIELPFGRAGRGLPVLVLLGSLVAILLITARLRRPRQPGSRPASVAPDMLLRSAIRQTRERCASARARAAALLHRRQRARRVREVELAVLDAARDDDRLAPQRITNAADALLRLVYLAWDARDPKRLATLMSPDLLAVWERALDADAAAGRHRRAQVMDEVKIDLVGLTAGAAGAATAIVLIEAELQIIVHNPDGTRASDSNQRPATQALCQYWTLALGEGPLTVRAIEERGDGDHHLSEPIVAAAVHQPGLRTPG